jgi:hypothetical protein
MFQHKAAVSQRYPILAFDQKHRFEVAEHLCEVCIGECDIVRFDHAYGRTSG